ncbi:ImmA/IrrE family metallo-endopeptidase [Amphritea sp.]|uniref:ImmA/IrrE family metallo-endopeptidase n=1 Tax=Amphritea sp. TaxID=1872502 RepID=UPI0025C6FF00|nr:ImmA/IrrE family metallo-endopeptidase [Amphritea sp.]
MAFIKKKPRERRAHSEFDDLSSATDVVKFANDHGIVCAPLDVSELTKLLGIKMRFEPMDGDESGSLKKEKKTDEWIMTINSLHHPHRQRFTIAHELGHFIQHSVLSDSFEDATFFRNGDMNRMETEANQFAAELLMPEDDFHSAISTGSQKVEDIAEFFHVSSMAVRIRAKSLGYQGHNL